jgi:hypothetical protein
VIVGFLDVCRQFIYGCRISLIRCDVNIACLRTETEMHGCVFACYVTCITWTFVVFRDGCMLLAVDVRH